MKRICSLFLFVCLLLFVSSASAYVVSHRYLIQIQHALLKFQISFLHYLAMPQILNHSFTNMIAT